MTSPGPEPAPPPRTPSRSAFLLAFAAVVVAGLLGGAIGYGLVDIGCRGDCGGAAALGALVGAVVAAGGVGVVGVLVLRAMAEWRVPLDPPAPGGGPRDPQESDSRRNPSA